MAIYYNVRPRYTPGSPAMVDHRTASKVAQDEADAHANTCTGVYGVDAMETAMRDSKRGIAEECTERADCWIVRDLITGDRYVRPFTRYGEKPKREQVRLWRLREKYKLPLEFDLQASA